MLAFLPTSLFLFAIFFGCSEIEAHGEKRIDDEPKYALYQDIYRAFNDIKNLSDFYWLYGFNYDSPHTKGKSCVYFDIEQISPQGMNYSSHFIRNGTKGTYPYTGNFSFTPAIDNYGKPLREKYNNLHSDLRSGGPWPMDYNLIYSDYVNCSIFRVPSIDQGNGCMVLVTDSKARSGMPKGCESMYRNACDRLSNRFHKIFGNNCTKEH